MHGAVSEQVREAIAQARRWYWQRISAMVLALCVLVHLGGMVYAVFVVACAVHVPVGVANIAREWGGFSERAARALSLSLALLLLVAGLRAVYAVVVV